MLLCRVVKYINSEETLKFVVGIEVPVHELESNKNMKQKDDDDKSYQNGKRSRFEQRESKLLLLKYNNYTPLNTT